MLNCILVCLLLVLSWQDIKEQMIYICIPLFGIILGIFLNTLSGFGIKALLGAVIGFSSLYIFNFIYKILRKKDGFGIGDVYVFSCIGAFLGVQELYSILLVACISALLCSILLMIFHKPCNKIAFVPFLSIGTIVVIFKNTFL